MDASAVFLRKRETEQPLIATISEQLSRVATADTPFASAKPYPDKIQTGNGIFDFASETKRKIECRRRRFAADT
jgi:hypothetical protein